MQTEALVAQPALEVAPPKPKTVSAHARAVLMGGTSILVGILWDISWHRTIGRDTFWTPAPMALYFGGLLGGLTCGWLIVRAPVFARAQEREGSVGVRRLHARSGASVTG